MSKHMYTDKHHLLDPAYVARVEVDDWMDRQYNEGLKIFIMFFGAVMIVGGVGNLIKSLI